MPQTLRVSLVAGATLALLSLSAPNAWAQG
jgi:hypothetical protein